MAGPPTGWRCINIRFHINHFLSGDGLGSQNTEAVAPPTPIAWVPELAATWAGPADVQSDQIRVRFNEGYWEQERRKNDQLVRERLIRMERAKALFVRHLTADQQRTLAERSFVPVTGSDGWMYRINTMHTTYNVALMRRQGTRYRSVVNLCALPEQTMPVWDKYLAQLLWIRTNAQEFKTIANVDRPMPEHWRETAGRETK